MHLNGLAVLKEIVNLLRQLVETGQGGSVDLSRVALSDEDYDLLDDALGEGEISAEMNLGATEVLASGVPGVWWITHYNAEDDVMAQFIEVAYCPEVLQVARDDVKEGCDALQARLFEEHLSG